MPVSRNIQPRRTVVWKIGGSVLTDRAAYPRAAAAVADALETDAETRLVVVVSAQQGVTDALEREARDVVGMPERSTLDLLWATGELQSVARLTFCLHARGVDAVGFNAHQCGLVATREDCTAKNSTFDARIDGSRLRSALCRHQVVVVPGFVAASGNGSYVTLGRGGSDLTAVLIASAIGAERCELIKDVPGYFTRDPALSAQAARLPRLSYEQALDMARAGCDLVQLDALSAAARGQTTLIVRSLERGAGCTVVSSNSTDDSEHDERATTPASAGVSAGEGAGYYGAAKLLLTKSSHKPIPANAGAR